MMSFLYVAGMGNIREKAKGNAVIERKPQQQCRNLLDDWLILHGINQRLQRNERFHYFEGARGKQLFCNDLINYLLTIKSIFLRKAYRNECIIKIGPENSIFMVN